MMSPAAAEKMGIERRALALQITGGVLRCLTNDERVEFKRLWLLTHTQAARAPMDTHTFDVTKMDLKTKEKTTILTNATRQACEKALTVHKMSQLRSKKGGKPGKEMAWMSLHK